MLRACRRTDGWQRNFICERIYVFEARKWTKSVYTIRRVQVNRDGLKLFGTHQLLVYAIDVNLLGGGVHTVKRNMGSLVAASKDTGLEVSADKTTYMVMSRDQNAGRSDNINNDNSSFERVEGLKYLGKPLN